MIDLPGHLKPIVSKDDYLDLLFKSRLPSDHKLVGTVVARSCSYVRKDGVQVSAISNYSISRILNRSQESCQVLLDDLVKYGWLFDTGRKIGARKMFVLTFSLLPIGEPKT